MPSSTRRTHYWLTFAVLAVSVCSYSLMQSLTIPVLPEIQEKLHTDQTTVTWVLTAYLLSASIFTPIMGRLGDALGKERILVLSLAILALGTLFTALAPNITMMIIARVIQGVGGGVIPLSFGIIRDEFPHHRISGAISVVSSLLAVGFGAGIVLAGPIVQNVGYAWLFWLPFIVAVLATIAAVVFVPESPVRTPGRIPLSPALLLSGWLICLLLALSQAPVWGWSSTKVIGLIVLAAILAAAWVFLERRVAVPLIDMNMMKMPAVWTTNLVALLVGVSMYASFAFFPQFNQTPRDSGYGFGASVTESGLLILPSAVGTFVTGLIAAPIAARIGPKVVVVIGCFVSAAATFMMAFAHDTKLEILVANGVQGFGMGLTLACLASLIVAAVSPEQTGVASGMNANIRTIGGSIGTALMSSIVTAHFLPNGMPKEIGYTRGFVLLAVALLLGGIAGLMIPSLTGRDLEERLEVEPDEPGLAVT